MLTVLRLARRLHTSVLLLWVICVGAASASPWLDPRPALDWVCNGSGSVRLVDVDGLAPEPTHARGLDCPMCLPLGTPIPIAQALAVAEARPDQPSADRPGVGGAYDRAQRPPARAPPPIAFPSQR